MMKICLLLILSWAGTIVFAQDKSFDIQSCLEQFMIEHDSLRQTYVGEKYPINFHVVTLDGDTINEKSLEGKVTLFNFWFETCAPCIAEFGELNRLYDKLKANPDFQFITFSTDAVGDIKRVIQKYQLRFPVCSISREEAYKLNFKLAFPTNIVIDKEAKVIYLKDGGPVEAKQVRERIKEIENCIINELQLK